MSLTEQLKALVILANKAGLQDAADFISNNLLKQNEALEKIRKEHFKASIKHQLAILERED